MVLYLFSPDKHHNKKDKTMYNTLERKTCYWRDQKIRTRRSIVANAAPNHVKYAMTKNKPQNHITWMDVDRKDHKLQSSWYHSKADSMVLKVKDQMPADIFSDREELNDIFIQSNYQCGHFVFAPPSCAHVGMWEKSWVALGTSSQDHKMLKSIHHH